MADSGTRGKLAIVVGGGPAPGINGVISSVTIEAINQGLEVVGVRDGFKHLVAGDVSHCKPLTIPDVAPYYAGADVLAVAEEAYSGNYPIARPPHPRVPYQTW